MQTSRSWSCRKLGAVGLCGAWLVGCAPTGKPDDATAKTVAMDRPETASATGKLAVTSPSFANGGAIPKEFTADGAGKVPEIRWSGLPKSTQEIALLVEDSDAPGDKPFVHLVVAGLVPSAKEYPASPSFIGQNSDGKAEYFPPAPPSGVHHYHFEVFAVDQATHISAGGREELLRAISGHVVAKGELVGLYGR